MRAPYDYSYADVMKHDPVGRGRQQRSGGPAALRDDDQDHGAGSSTRRCPRWASASGSSSWPSRRGRDVQAEVRSQGPEQARRGPHHGEGIRDEPEPRVLRRRARRSRKTDLKPWFVNADDKSIEGLVHTEEALHRGPVPPGGIPRALRHRVRLRQVRLTDGRQEDGR